MNTARSRVTVVMYHYVRPLAKSRYPSIRGLEYELFKHQLKYLAAHYTFITAEELIAAIDAHQTLPDKAVLLTFDDAYRDHFEYVFPLLDKMKVQGCFFPPVKAVTEHKVLDVNKIHFILASEPDVNTLVKQLFVLLDAFRAEFALHSHDYYWQKYAIATRFDSKEVIFIKRLLQVGLEEQVRKIIVDKLFDHCVNMSEETFSKELYMSVEQIECMRRNGMHIGSHGYDHYWLSSLPKEKQAEEIEKSVDFIERVGGERGTWSICYPYGDYNEDTLAILKQFGCKLGFTTHVDTYAPAAESRFVIPRLDTNDFSVESSASVNEWYCRG